MKHFIAIIPIFLVLIAESAFAQLAPPAVCTIDYCDQCFPYKFCNDSGQSYVKCSNDPTEDGTPAKSWIPSCVEVDAMWPQGIWMPQTAVPVFKETAPSRTTVWNNYRDSCLSDSTFAKPPWAVPYNIFDAYYWSFDSSAYVAALEQWNLDSINFFADSGSDEINTTGLDDTATNTADFYWSQDFSAYIDYEAQYSSYQTDSTRHFTGNDVPYSQIWNQTQADTDANNALQGWLNQCSPPVAPTGILTGCCLHIILDTNAADFDNPVTNLASTVTNLDSLGFPTCDETLCPFFTRFVEVNTSNAFFYATTNPKKQHPDSTYILHPVSLWGFYTSEIGPPPIESGFNEVSFFQLMEHEIGHFLGMFHPDDTTDNGSKCNNCYTNNPLFSTDALGNVTYHPTGFHTVMAQGNDIQNSPPMQLTNEDIYQFQKLYCPQTCLAKGGLCALSGVSQPAPAPDWFNPEVFPNPTSGGMTLSFTVNERSLTQISIYDILGNQVRMVSEGYSNEGPQSISLGTESLPSGNYVCRVRVGDRVSYINLAITK